MTVIPTGKKVLTVGETLVRFSPTVGRRLEQSGELERNVAGSESNLAVSLALLGIPCRWVGGLPGNPLGRYILRHLAGLGVDVSEVVIKEKARQGIFFIEYGSAPRPTQVIYDRKNSAASQLGPEDMRGSWFEDIGHVHLTGITPALSDSCHDLVMSLMDESVRRGIPVSFDLNYRAGLWSPSEAAANLEPLLKMVSVLIVKEDDAREVLRAKGPAEDIACEMLSRYEVSVVALTCGSQEAIAVDSKGGIHRAPAHRVEVVDKLGAGDAFAAGLLYGYLMGDLDKGLDYGQAMAAWKYSVYGDDALFTRDEIERLIQLGPEQLRR